jgi:16S rRNA (guanine527-N7)-methyltransferase
MATESFQRLLLEGCKQLNIELTGEMVAQLTSYKELIQTCNTRFNLTTISDDAGIATTHMLDALSGWNAIGLAKGARVVDIGAGAGLPGLAIKIVRPDIDLVLIEANSKKARFIADVASSLRLERVGVRAERAEESGRSEEMRDSFELAVARALASLSTILEYALPLVCRGGIVLSYKAEVSDEEMSAAKNAASLLGGSIEKGSSTVVPFLNAKRFLVVTRKEAPTDERYPRRVGIPAKRPLGFG